LKSSKEAEVATEAHDKAKSELAAASDNKKLQEAEKRAAQKAGPLNDKAKAADAAYHKSVDLANETITKTFGEYLPPLIDSLQTLEEERYHLLRDTLQQFLSAQRGVPANLEERVQDIDKHISAIDIESDLTEFVDSHRSATTEAEKIKFVAFKEPSGESSSSGGSATTTTIKEVEKVEEKVEKVEVEKVVEEKETTPTKSEDDLF